MSVTGAWTKVHLGRQLAGKGENVQRESTYMGDGGVKLCLLRESAATAGKQHGERRGTRLRRRRPLTLVFVLLGPLEKKMRQLRCSGRK